jgi:hypothetical protein
MFYLNIAFGYCKYMNGKRSVDSVGETKRYIYMFIFPTTNANRALNPNHAN